MSGALIQLVAYGTLDNYLIGDDIKLFKIGFLRHSNFSIEPIELTFNDSVDFNTRRVIKILKNGDLLGPLFLKATLPVITSVDSSVESRWVNRVGFCLLRKVELKIGGQTIDQLYSTWMHIWSELTFTKNKKAALSKMIGTKGSNGKSEGLLTDTNHVLIIPLLFSFCRHFSLAIPLISLEYNEIELIFDFETLENCYSVDNTINQTTNSLTGSLTDVSLITNYIYIDPIEKENFATNTHEYLIETLQVATENYQVESNKINKVPLILYHPIKEIYWVIKKDSNLKGDKFTDFTKNAVHINSINIDDVWYYNSGISGTINSFKEASILINEIKKIKTSNQKYFNFIQPYQHHTGYPDIGINCYSFSLYPEKHHPSGTINCTKINKIDIELYSHVEGKIIVYGLGYNILKIKSGFGTLVYQN
uniref:Major capsid protein n=1 Tax=Megaviridae environmental sample TaxID=1737588 RepID=A0A5J6VK67_9VIRU|nr:MAG: major capsid protein [Megaviridae environmental sample]